MIDISIRKKQPFVRDIICRCTRSLAMVWARRPMFNFNFERSQLRTTGSKGGSKGGMGNFHIFFTPPKNPIINTCINDDIFVLFVSHFVVSVSCQTPDLLLQSEKLQHSIANLEPTSTGGEKEVTFWQICDVESILESLPEIRYGSATLIALWEQLPLNTCEGVNQTDDVSLAKAIGRKTTRVPHKECHVFVICIQRQTWRWPIGDAFRQYIGPHLLDRAGTEIRWRQI